MRKSLKIFVAALCALALPQITNAQKVDELKFYNVKTLLKNGDAVMIGQGAFETNDACYYYRLPNKLKGVVRKEVWDLGTNSAGIAIRFSSDAKCIGAKWTLTNNFSMMHMAHTGIKGMDLYVLDVKRDLGAGTSVAKNSDKKQKKAVLSTKDKFKEAFSSLGSDLSKAKDGIVSAMEGKEWKFAGTAFPNGKNSANVFIREMAGGKREYMIYLPLYDGIEKLEIGVDSAANISAPSGALIPEYRKNPDSKEGLPIVFYGTSVTQGGCASRPGMAYPSIISRTLNTETVNLGFSGNGRMDANMADFISGLPASAYVIDCLANCKYEMTRDSSSYFISRIATAHPETPVYMVTNYHKPAQFILPESNDDLIKENILWKKIFEELSTKGTMLDGKPTGPMKNLRFIDVSSEYIIGNEDTVDGTHLTDMGFTHFAKELLRYLGK